MLSLHGISACSHNKQIFFMLRKLILLLARINILKTIHLNLRYFKLSDALKLPILVYPNTKIEKAQGKIVCKCPIKTGLISVGKHGVGNRFRTIWIVSGRMQISGPVNFGSGTKISIGDDAKLILGSNVTVTGDSSIICKKQITIGTESIISWDVLIMDTDYHKISNIDGGIMNMPLPIKIGNHVWIACRVTVLKGSFIADNSIVACSSLISSKCENRNTIYGGGKSITRN